MSLQLIGYSNLIDSSTLTANGTFTSARPLTNLQERELAIQAQSGTATKIYIDHGSAKTARLAWIAAHNLASGDTVQIDRGTTSGGVDVYAGSALSAWPHTPLVGTRDGAVYGIPLVMPAANSARYTTITIPAGCRIGRIFIGPAFEPYYGVEELTDDFLPPNSTISRSMNGADWVTLRNEIRGSAMTFPALTYAEGALLEEIIYTHSIASEVVWIPDRNDRADSQRRGCLGTLRKLSQMDYPFWEHNGTAIAIDARGGAP